MDIDGLTKKFGATVAVNNVSFSVAAGEIFSLIGPNGSGKTTIIKTVAGLLKPTSGAVLVDSLEVTRYPVATKSKIGYIPDEPTAWSGMTGEEFLHIVGALYGLDDETRKERIKELLPLFGFEGIEKEYFADYSRGNKQKFTILGALLHQPKLLLVDEPIVGLDPKSAAIAKNEFVRFAENGGAVLIATHTLPVAEEISTRIGLLKSGQLAASGTLAELKTKAGKSRTASLEDVYMSLA